MFLIRIFGRESKQISPNFGTLEKIQPVQFYVLKILISYPGDLQYVLFQINNGTLVFLLFSYFLWF